MVFPALFASIAAGPICGDLVPITERVRPDVIVREPSELAVVPLARGLGVLSICVGFGRFVPDEVLAARRTADPRWRAGVRVPGVWHAPLASHVCHRPVGVGDSESWLHEPLPAGSGVDQAELAVDMGELFRCPR